MTQFKAILKKFEEKGEKTGWTYFDVSNEIANKILPNTKKSFRVKGKINECTFEKSSLYPMGDGNFIFALNSSIRTKLRLNIGVIVNISMEFDESKAELPPIFIEMLDEDIDAKSFFYNLPKTAQSNFKHYMLGAKSENAKAKNIALVLNALTNKMTPKEMITAEKIRKGLR